MRFPLRWRLLLLTGAAPAVLALGTYAYLSGVVTAQVRRDVDDSLTRAALVFEKQFGERSEALGVAARVIVRDPRFFSAVALPGGAADPGARATVRGIALDFQRLTHADVFEVWDRRGRVLASIGASASSPGDRARLMQEAARGREFSGLLVDRQAHWQVALAPVTADGALVGALLVGSAIGPELARELHVLTRGEVTFVDDGFPTGTSLADTADVRAMLVGVGARLQHPSAVPVEILEHSGAWVTLARPLPGTLASQGQSFVIQRPLGEEIAFLRRAQKALLELALIAVLIAGVLSVITAERITRPILALVRGAEAMERGDYDAPIEVGGADEIGYLGSRFREMRAREREYVTALEEVARLKSEFISLASHQLRTPITVIKGYNELFYEGALGNLTPHQRQALAAIQESVEGLVRLTEDATRMAQIEGERLILDREHQDLAPLVGEAVAEAQRDAIGRHLTVEQHLPEGLVLAYVDGPRLAQALANLVRNGIRFTPEGGRVDVRLNTDPAGCVLEVTDTGVGIAPEQQKQLFTRAFMVRDVAHLHSSNTLEFGSAGLGLGLAIARGIVEAHGGTIAVESTPGKGSVFTIRIPRLALLPPGSRGPRERKQGPDEGARSAA